MCRSRSGILHFRITIPPDLRNHFDTKEIHRSLGTASVRDAQYSAHLLAATFKQAFERIRQDIMAGKSKKADKGLEIDFITHIDLDEFGRRKRITLQSEPHDTPETIKAHLAAFSGNTVADAPSSSSSPILLSEAIEDFVREKLVRNRWQEKTEEENRAIYDLFIQIVGDKPVAEIDNELIVTYLETLKKLPPNRNKSPIYAGKSIAEIIELSPEPMAVRTINKNLERMSSLFKWMRGKKKYNISYNPIEGMSLDEGDAAKRVPFTEAELSILFNSEEFRLREFQNPYAYWLMPLGLLTGARLGELAQLYLSDFVNIDGIHCIDISDEQPDQKVKNKNAKRLVPIHDKLIELGILRYVEMLRQKGETRLFPEINEGRDGYAQTPSKWFQRHKKKCGIVDKHTKVFHSFRHTFISTLLDNDVPEHSVAKIVGHETNLITGNVYWNGKDASKRKPTIDKYQPPERVWTLIPKWEDVVTGKRKGPRKNK